MEDFQKCYQATQFCGNMVVIAAGFIIEINHFFADMLGLSSKF
jgi:hypothetical protein